MLALPTCCYLNQEGRYFYDLHSGVEKIGEGRDAKSRMATSTKVGDLIKIWQINDNGVKVCYLAKVLGKDEYENITALLSTVGVSRMLPDVFTVEEGVKMYREKFNMGTGRAMNIRVRAITGIYPY